MNFIFQQDSCELDQNPESSPLILWRMLPHPHSPKALYKTLAKIALIFLRQNFKNVITLLYKVLPRRGTLVHSCNQYEKVSAFWGNCCWCFHYLETSNTDVSSGNDVLMLHKPDFACLAQAQDCQGHSLNEKSKFTEQTLKAAKGRKPNHQTKPNANNENLYRVTNLHWQKDVKFKWNVSVTKNKLSVEFNKSISPVLAR